ncbi:hypothetical protein EI94DRAFT_1800872 [Lactarius quietus]|nr:hypothetical protein EI94DRAFT_1800872 [Lactarius quietus]
MATRTQTTPSVFPRIRFGFGHKSSRMRLPPDPPQNPDDGDWYLPYNGPYELPPAVPREQNRDSWGQVIDTVLGDLGAATSHTDRTDKRSSGNVEGGRVAFPLPGSGAYSSHPYRTSTATDTTTISRARGVGQTSTITSSTAFAHIDNTGGVGESPAPMGRSSLHTASQPGGGANRLSLANLLSFGASTRKSRSDSVHSSHRPSTKRSRNPDPLQSNRPTGLDVRLPPCSHSLAHPGPSTDRPPRRRSNTLIGTSMAPAPTQSSSRKQSTTSQHRDSPLSAHPYAYAYPSSHSGAPRRAPIVSPPLTQSHSLDKGKGVDRSYQYPQPPSTDTLNVAEVPPHLRPTARTSLLKTISAPNLRNLSRGLSLRKAAPSRGKSRWLSPETWCDALLFPRPRFLEHIDGESSQPVGQRNVSIPAPKAHDTVARTTREQMPLGRSLLRGSRSAVNLHMPNLDSSRGPPRAEPMLMPIPRPPHEGDRSWSAFSRPRSFAQDDLAIPSPVPSLVRVLEMGASFERERATWRSKAERSLQSSKLTRSLGRSRSQSAGRTRAQLKDMGGVGFLATKTLLGNQLVAPTVGSPTSSEGTQTQQTRSGTSHARTMSSGGHSRAGSKGKIAVMRAATGLCISSDKTTPPEERGDVITRYGKSAGIEVQHLMPNSFAAPSPSPVAMDSATVGIALSSPLPSTEEVATVPERPLTYARDHPYAQGGMSISVPRRSHTRSNSDYAGPHPSAVAVSAHASDMSARHRLPPQAVFHPYATSSAPPSAGPSQPARPPSPIAPLPEVPAPSRSRTNPRSSLRQPLVLSDTVPHAYAADNRFSRGPLVFADALSYGLQRRFSADSGLGSTDIRRSAQTSSADDPGAGSRASSPLQSPRPFGTIEDLDRYRNLFYYPKGSVVSGTPSDEHHRTFSRDTASLVGHEVSSTGSVAGGSGLAALTRHLGNNEDATTDEGHSSRMWWLHGRTDANVVHSTMSDVYSNSDLNTNRSDPDATLLPLSMHQSMHPQSEGSFTTRVPQDVDSHISSVLLERPETEHVDDELLRVGTVGVAPTPLATTPADTRLSFAVSSTYTGDATDNDDHDEDGDDVDDDDDEGEGDSTLPPLLVVSTMRSSGSGHLDISQPQSVPQSAMTEATRSSYMTNDTATASCISGLSDFPVPPSQTIVSLERVEALKSYFADDQLPPALSRRISVGDVPRIVTDGQVTAEQPPVAGPSHPSRKRSTDDEPELQQ